MDEERSYEDLFEEDEDVTGEIPQVDEDEEVEPVNLGKKKVGTIVIVALVGIILLLLLGRSISISVSSKKYAQQLEAQNAQQSSVQQSIENLPAQSQNNTQNPAVMQGSESGSVGSGSGGGFVENSGDTPATGTNSSNINITVNPQGSESANQGIVEGNIIEGSTSIETQVQADFEQLVTEPAYGSEVEVKGIVKGISTYKVGNSYTYGVGLILVTGNDTNIECTYFCPRKTASSLVIGDSLVVTYQMDSAGNICVVTISK